MSGFAFEGDMGHPVEGRSTMTRGRGGRWFWRNRWVAASLVGAILVIVASQGPLSGIASNLIIVPLDPKAGELPVDSEALRQAEATLPERFVRHETARFVALSDGSTAWTREQLERFERAHHQFMRFLRWLGMPEPELRHKLVAVLFEEHADFVEYASRVDRVGDPWVKGYYTPAGDRLVGFDAESDPRAVEARTRLAEQDRAISQASSQARARRGSTGRIDPAANVAIDRARSMQGLGEEDVVLAIRQQVVSTMIHEAIHQLLFHTGVQNPSVAPPFWLAEGLATSFETDQPSAAFGPDFDFRPRREVFERLLMEDRLVSLESFVAFEMLPDRRESTARVFYHQSSALLSYLYRQRPSELRRYLDRLAAEPPGRPGPARQRALFEECFGEIDALERAWLRWELGRIAHEDASSRRAELDGPALRMPASLFEPATRTVLGGQPLPSMGIRTTDRPELLRDPA
jgi:hypothetical protein